jgi:hypothetical protein
MPDLLLRCVSPVVPLGGANKKAFVGSLSSKSRRSAAGRKLRLLKFCRLDNGRTKLPVARVGAFLFVTCLT